MGDNSAYWAAKEVGTVTLETGFRVWKNKNDKAVVGAADNGSFQYALADFSDIKKPDVPKEEDDSDEPVETDQSGAYQAIAAGAALLLSTLLWS